MSQADPHGYYSCLGLSPSALPAEIKRAYRARAMSLHPDRNQGQDTTSQFQQVVRAYEVLSNPDLRHHYDQLQFAPEPVAQTPEVWPVHCTRCGCVSPHARFRSFSLVVGFVFTGLKTQTQGVFCERCEPKVAVRSTLVNVLAGWWSIQTVYANLQGLISNLRGGPFFLEQNARMMFMQAQHFRANGLKDIASALASQAYKMLSAHNPKTSWNRAKAWVADGWRLHEDPETKKLILSKRGKAFFSACMVHVFRFPKQVPTKESLDLLKQDLRFFLDQSEGKIQTTKVSSRSWWLGPAFMMQVALILSVFGGVLAFSVYRPLLRQHLPQANEVQDFSPMVQEQVLPSLNAVDLPISGVYQSSKPIEAYATGLFPSLKLQAKPGHHYYVKLTDLNTGESEMSVFIRGGEEIEFPVPPGVYQVKFVWGNTWYGEQNLFGPEGLYKAFDVQFEFWKTDRKAQRSGLTLDTENDNISRLIPSTEF